MQLSFHYKTPNLAYNFKVQLIHISKILNWTKRPRFPFCHCQYRQSIARVNAHFYDERKWNLDGSDRINEPHKSIYEENKSTGGAKYKFSKKHLSDANLKKNNQDSGRIPTQVMDSTEKES